VIHSSLKKTAGLEIVRIKKNVKRKMRVCREYLLKKPDIDSGVLNDKLS